MENGVCPHSPFPNREVLMNQKIYLTNMFPDYEPPEELRAALSQAAIVAADIDMEARGVHVLLHSDSFIPQRLLSSTAREIGQLYGLRSLVIEATHPETELCKMEKEELILLPVVE